MRRHSLTSLSLCQLPLDRDNLCTVVAGSPKVSREDHIAVRRGTEQNEPQLTKSNVVFYPFACCDWRLWPGLVAVAAGGGPCESAVSPNGI
jgi:hypothetical protein